MKSFSDDHLPRIRDVAPGGEAVGAAVDEDHRDLGRVGYRVADQPQPVAAARADFAGVEHEKERAAGVAAAARTLVFG